MTDQSPTTRRTFLTATGTGALLAASGTLAPRVTRAQSIPAGATLELGNTAVSEITMVARDAEASARKFSEVFGPSWDFYEFRPQKLSLHDKPLADAACVLKVAVGVCGGQTFKLVQPVSGTSSYAEFLQKNGEGFYSIGLGALRGFAGAMAAIKGAIGVEMQGDAGDGSTFVVLDTAADLGCRVEIHSVPTQETSPWLKHTGSYVPKQPAIFDMRAPVMIGGRRFTQIGLVVKDANKTAARWEALLGLRGWRFIPIPISAGAYRGQALAEAELPSATVTQGVAYLGGMQIELLAPVETKPGGVHRRFLDQHGDYNGFQHLMISPATNNREKTLAQLKAHGYVPEWTATVHIGNMTGNGDYIDLEQALAGFVLEYNG